MARLLSRVETKAYIDHRLEVVGLSVWYARDVKGKLPWPRSLRMILVGFGLQLLWVGSLILRDEFGLDLLAGSEVQFLADLGELLLLVVGLLSIAACSLARAANELRPQNQPGMPVQSTIAGVLALILALVTLGLACSAGGPSSVVMFLLPPDEPDRGQLVTMAQQEQIVVSKAEERQIRQALRSILRRKPAFALGSRYLKCRAHYKLLKFGVKALPYLLEQVGRWQASYTYLGAAGISDAKLRTVKEVFDHNESHRNETMRATLAPWLLTILMEELAPVDGTPRRERKSGIASTDCLFWLGWWQENRHRFTFETDNPPIIPAPVGTSTRWLTSTSVQDGLLDIRALHATQRHIIERAAAELGLDVFIGAHRGIDIITSIHMRSVTFEEFLYFLDGITYRKEGERYLIGDQERAKPRWYIHGWGIRMWQTVFYPGDGIHASVLVRLDLIPSEEQVLDEGRFVIEDPKDPGRLRKCRVLPAAQGDQEHGGSVCKPSGDGLVCYLVVDPRCGLTPGEFTMHFAWAGEHTPKISIELYQE